MIKRPAWAKGAIPTTRGWVRGKEILKLRTHTQAEVDEWMAANGEVSEKPVKLVEAKVAKAKTPRKKKEPTVKQAAVLLSEAPVANKSIGDMTIVEAEALSNQYNVKIDAENNVTLTESSTPSE